MKNFLFSLIIPLIKFVAKIGLPDRKINGIDYYNVRDEIIIGDILLTRKRFELSNFFIPSIFTHGAIYVGRIKNNQVCYVLEATTKGVRLTDLVTFLTEKDRVICYRTREKICVKTLQHFAKSVIGYKYDYYFQTKNKRYYCFELLADALYGAGPIFVKAVKLKLKAHPVFIAESFMNIKLFKFVFELKGKNK